MPVAPRFNPDGVRVGSMPVPQVRPQTGLAEGLASVGESIAGLGKTVDRVQDRQEQREALAKAQQAASLRASTTAGTDAAMVWRERNESRLAKMRQAKMGNVYDAYEKFDSESSADDGQDLIEKLDPIAKEAFNKQTALWRMDLNTKAQTFAAEEHRQYTVATTSKAQAIAESDAAFQFAAGKDNEAAIHRDNAIRQAAVRSSLTGEPVDPESITGSIALNALQLVARTDEEAAVRRYDRWIQDNSFGPYKDNAERFIAPIRKNVEITADAEQIAAMSTKDGIFMPEMAQAEALKRQAGGMPDEDYEKLRLKLAKFGEADLKRRNAIADDLLDDLSIWQSANSDALGTARDPQAFMAMPGVEQKLALMPKDKRVVFEDRISRGPTHSNPEHKAILRGILAAGDRRELASVTRWQYSISQADWEDFDKQRQVSDAPIEKAIKTRVGERWTNNGTRPPPPRATRDKPKLSSSEQQENAKYNATERFVSAYMASKEVQEAIRKDPNSMTMFIDRAYDDATRPIEITVEGEKVMTTVAESNLLEMGFEPTDEMMTAAGVKSLDEPMARAKIIRVKQQMDAEKAQQELEADAERRLRESGRPMTDAAMQAQRNVIGAMWAVGGAKRVQDELLIMDYQRAEAAAEREREEARKYAAGMAQQISPFRR